MRAADSQPKASQSVGGVGNSSCGSEPPKPTQPRSDPNDTRSTHPFHSDSTGHSARNPTHRHTAPQSDPAAAIWSPIARLCAFSYRASLRVLLSRVFARSPIARHRPRQNTPRASHPQFPAEPAPPRTPAPAMAMPSPAARARSNPDPESLPGAGERHRSAGMSGCRRRTLVVATRLVELALTSWC
ncbi:MAG: hypothetical protein ACJAUC_002460 [Planctomycetota bacterium]|jgi:hypothetical protein